MAPFANDLLPNSVADVAQLEGSCLSQANAVTPG